MVTWPSPTLIRPLVLGTAHFNDSDGSTGATGGAIQSLRNIALAAPTANAVNKPFFLQNTFTGINLDSPVGGAPQYATSITNILGDSKGNGFSTGNFGFRSFGVVTIAGPGTVGGSISGVDSILGQTAPFPPGILSASYWATSTVYAPNTGITNRTNGASYYTVLGGTSASSGTGPSGYGSAITDGTVTWVYQGPGVPRFWAATTSYNQGELVINPNNGGLYLVVTPGISGAFPGPVRPRAALTPALLATTGSNITLSGTPIIDSVQTAIGNRVLVKDQTAQADNGVYIVASGAWARSPDMDTWGNFPSAFVSILSGTINANAGFLCTSAFGGTLGTTPITWISSAAPNINAIPDGSVVWALRTVGSQAQQYIASVINSTISFNAGGQSFIQSIGVNFGAVLGSKLLTNATFYSQSVVLELDDVVQGSARNVGCLKLVRVGKQGFFFDVGVILTAATAAVTPDGTPIRGYRNGLLFNNYIDVDVGYGISFEANGNFQLQHMAGTFDAKMVMADGTGKFGGGFIFRWFNGLLDQFGAQQMRFGSITPTASGLTIDVTNQELQSLAIVSGGAGWSAGDGWKSSDGSVGTVNTVDGSGAITAVHINLASQPPAASLPGTVTLSPFNPEASFQAFGNDPIPGSVGPTGDPIWATPATATPTYAAPATPTLNFGTGLAAVINLGRAGQSTNINGVIKLGSDNQIANGSVATVLGSLGPVGSHTTVQEWMAIKNNAGTVRYIPCF